MRLPVSLICIPIRNSSADTDPSICKKINVKKKNEDWNEKIEKEFFSKLVKQFDYQSNPLYSSSRLWDDGIIDPRDTRNILSECLQISLNSKIKKTKFGLFRM